MSIIQNEIERNLKEVRLNTKNLIKELEKIKNTPT